MLRRREERLLRMLDEGVWGLGGTRERKRARIVQPTNSDDLQPLPRYLSPADTLRRNQVGS